MILVSDAKCIHLNYPFFQVRYIQLQLRVYSSSGVFKKLFENLFKTYLHQCNCLHRLDENEKVLEIILTAVHFTDQNWISKTVYYSFRVFVWKLLKRSLILKYSRSEFFKSDT